MAAGQVAASGGKWLQVAASGCLGKWLLGRVAAGGCKWLLVVASGCLGKWLLGQVAASGSKWLQVAIQSELSSYAEVKRAAARTIQNPSGDWKGG